MRSIITLLFLFSLSNAFATDFYYRCQNEDKKIELDFNLTRGTWLSLKGLSPYWTHLMLMEVKPETLVFEVREAGEGEADFLLAEVPANFLKGSSGGEIIVRSLIIQEESESFLCSRDESQED